MNFLKELNFDEIVALRSGRMQSDFPPEEIKPIWLFKRQFERGQFKAYDVWFDNQPKAYCFFQIPNEGDAWLLDYLAVYENERGKGYGSEALKLIKNSLPCEAVLLEIERTDEADGEIEKECRQKRKNFYLNNNVVETGITSVADGGIGYEILCLPIKKRLFGTDAALAVKKIYQTLFNEGEYAVNCPNSADSAVKTVEVVAALVWRDGKFMICQRPKHKARGLMWEFVGGKVENGETKRQALMRECREELAAEVEPSDVFAEVRHVYPDITINLTVFNAKIAYGEPKKLEHNDIKWISPDEIDRFEFCPADTAVLQKIKDAFCR